ncbi:MAG: bifunctional DedA family/phosphatase PAP2 family protein [Patescibacteria group bacterium]
MSDAVTTVVSLLQQVLEHGGYWIITLISCLEALPLIGSIVPGHTVVVAGGFFAKLGVLNLYYVIGLATLGAIVGDGIGYYLGKRYGYSLVTRYGKYFLVNQEQIDKAKALLAKHTGKSLVFGRFNPISRAFMPFFAGTSRVDPVRFWVYNIVGGIIWAVSSVLIGYVFGASYTIVAHYIGRFTLIGLGLSLLLVIAYRFINKRRHIFAKYQLYTLIISVFSLYIFFKTLQDTISIPSYMANLDVWVAEMITFFHTGWAITTMGAISHIISPETLTFAAFAMAIWYAYKRHWHNVWIILASYPVGLAWAYTLKAVVGRVRPLTMLVPETGFSFPSGHATASALFFSIIVYLAIQHSRHRIRREVQIVLAVIAAALIGFSRLYIGVHWFSDVVAGYALGIFWFTFSVLTIRYVEALIRGRKAKQLH